LTILTNEKKKVVGWLMEKERNIETFSFVLKNSPSLFTYHTMHTHPFCSVFHSASSEINLQPQLHI